MPGNRIKRLRAGTIVLNNLLALGLPILFTVFVIFLAWLEFHHYAGRDNDSDKNEKDNL